MWPAQSYGAFTDLAHAVMPVTEPVLASRDAFASLVPAVFCPVDRICDCIAGDVHHGVVLISSDIQFSFPVT